MTKQMNQIAWDMADGRIDEVALRSVVELANRLQVARVATGVLADASAPFVARCRAFGQVSAAIAAVPPVRVSTYRLGAA